MVPLLLLLLLPESLADPVCFNISNGGISTTIINGSILEIRTNHVKCDVKGDRCTFQCTFNNMTWFNGSSFCLDAKVTKFPIKDEYSFQPNITCNLFVCNVTVILQLIKSLNNDNSDQKEMMQLFYIRHSCPKLFSTNTDTKAAFVEAERKIIHNIMRRSQLETGGSIEYSLRDLSLNVVNISEDALSSSGTTSRIQLKVPQLLPQNESFLPETWLPVSALQTIPKEERIIGLVSYMEHSQFQFEQENISSMVLRIELLGERRLHNLKTSIKMIFRVATHIDIGNDSRLQCCYFNEHDWLWKADGCETHDNGQNGIICQCSHTTAFAVLLVRQPVEEVHWKILSYISYIGCGLSAFFTSLSLVMYFFSRKDRIDHSISIHVSLSGALFLLNTTFLLTEWGATVEQEWVCVFVAAFMHYSLLCCFTWMAIEALHLYLLLIKVFNTHYKHYLAKLSLVGWGIPGVIVTVSLGMKDFKQFYGVTQMTMADTNQTNEMCWITDDSFFYSLNLVYFTLTFIFNSGILVAVASSICRMKAFMSRSKFGAQTDEKTWSDPKRFSESCRSGLTVLGLTWLMGTTWGLAFLGSGYVNYPILYLFCILNSLQGFFIFVWICQSTKKQRRRDMENRISSTPVKTMTSGIKSD